MRNKYLLGAVVFGIVLQVSVISIPPFASVFKVFGLSSMDWLVIGILALMPLVFNEIAKLVRRVVLNSRKRPS